MRAVEVSWGTKIFSDSLLDHENLGRGGGMLMGYEIFRQNYWFAFIPNRALLMTSPQDRGFSF